jgi:hypothetical protein
MDTSSTSAAGSFADRADRGLNLVPVPDVRTHPEGERPPSVLDLLGGGPGGGQIHIHHGDGGPLLGEPVTDSVA